jgi:translation initiation factor 4G
LLRPGEGNSNAEKAVKRIDVDDLLEMRLNYIAPPSSWEGDDATKPPAACLWDSPTRLSDIKEASNAPRIGGDVSLREKSKRIGGQGGKSNPNDTAPPLEECKPLDVNDETRWKAKVMDGGKEVQAEEAEGKDEILRKAMLILNKLSLTKFDKLSDEFISCGIGRDIECLTGAVGLIVTYAQEQQHFSSMYASLCLKLANTPMEGIDDGLKKGKKFKKILLERCQTEFETDTSTKIKEATKGIADADAIEYHSNLIKKHYLGHMRFIGELYKGELISIKIMLMCLPALLMRDNEESSDDIDEEKVVCFTKLMTVIGSSLELQSEAMKADGKADAADSLADCWKKVATMARESKKDGPKVSKRIKFMLQDLLEMKENGKFVDRSLFCLSCFL